MTFEAILAIPGALLALTTLLQKAKVEKIPSQDNVCEIEEELTQSRRALQGAESQIVLIRDQMQKFAVSFDALEAWKRIHDITTDLEQHFEEHGFNYLEQYNSADTFKRALTPELRTEIEQIINTAHTKRSFLHKIKSFKSSKVSKALGPVDYLGGRPEDERCSWDEEIIKTLDELRDLAANGGPKEVFVKLFSLKAFNTSLNREANDKLREGVEEYHQVIEKFLYGLENSFGSNNSK